MYFEYIIINNFVITKYFMYLCIGLLPIKIVKHRQLLNFGANIGYIYNTCKLFIPN